MVICSDCFITNLVSKTLPSKCITFITSGFWLGGCFGTSCWILAKSPFPAWPSVHQTNTWAVSPGIAKTCWGTSLGSSMLWEIVSIAKRQGKLKSKFFVIGSSNSMAMIHAKINDSHHKLYLYIIYIFQKYCALKLCFKANKTLLLAVGLHTS